MLAQSAEDEIWKDAAALPSIAVVPAAKLLQVPAKAVDQESVDHGQYDPGEGAVDSGCVR
jgi:hypothetical protein